MAACLSNFCRQLFFPTCLGFILLVLHRWVFRAQSPSPLVINICMILRIVPFAFAVSVFYLIRTDYRETVEPYCKHLFDSFFTLHDKLWSWSMLCMCMRFLKWDRRCRLTPNNSQTWAAWPMLTSGKGQRWNGPQMAGDCYSQGRVDRGTECRYFTISRQQRDHMSLKHRSAIIQIWPAFYVMVFLHYVACPRFLTSLTRQWWMTRDFAA